MLHFGERQPAEGAGEGADHRGVRRKDDGFPVVLFGDAQNGRQPARLHFFERFPARTACQPDVLHPAGIVLGIGAGDLVDVLPFPQPAVDLAEALLGTDGKPQRLSGGRHRLHGTEKITRKEGVRFQSKQALLQLFRLPHPAGRERYVRLPRKYFFHIGAALAVPHEIECRHKCRSSGAAPLIGRSWSIASTSSRVQR